MATQSQHLSQYVDQRFQLLVNAVTDYAIYMLDPDGMIATWNPGARRFKGYEAEEVIGTHFSRFFNEEDRAARLPWRALETAATEGRFEGEGWRYRKDGTRFWAHVVIDPIRDDMGLLLGFAKITRDVTERRETERALFESEQRFRLLVQGVRDYAIYMLDTNGIVTNWNSGAEAIKGYRAEEIVGRHFSTFYTPEDAAAGEPQRALETALREGKYEREAWRVRKDGTRFYASILIDPVRNDAGTLIGFAKITRDITDRLRVEQELEEARNALFQSQKLQALGELTGGIAHDFNNLMTVIRGSAELLQRPGLTPERQRRYLDAIVETADRAATLTDHLLAFGRRQPLKPEVIDINLRLDAFAEVVTRTLGSKISVVLDLAPDLDRIEVDPTQLETALLNAAINARDAMPEGGSLTFATRNVDGKKGPSVEILIHDTGTGMPPEVLEHVFEPFFTTKPVGKGTGLGLSQLYGFVAQAGGEVDIESAEGAGTTLRLRLPRSDKALPGQMFRARNMTIPKELVVLLVEDNDQVRHFAEHLLREIGCKVVSASDGAEALALLKKERVDMVLSDIVMPGMSGLELARRIRAVQPELPVLLATGYSAEMLRESTSDFAMIAKPYGYQSLSTAIAKLVGTPRE